MRNASSLGLSSVRPGPGPGRPALPRDVACSRVPWTEKAGPPTLVSVGRHGGTSRNRSTSAAPVGSALACAAGARLARARSGLLFQQAPCVCTSASVELGERRFFRTNNFNESFATIFFSCLLYLLKPSTSFPVRFRPVTACRHILP